MDYTPRIIDGITLEEIESEISAMLYNEYAYGRCIDRPRMWDLQATRKKILQEELKHVRGA